MRDFISESIRDLSVGLIIASIIALLIEQKAFVGAVVVFTLGVIAWGIAFKIKMRSEGGE